MYNNYDRSPIKYGNGADTQRQNPPWQNQQQSYTPNKRDFVQPSTDYKTGSFLNEQEQPIAQSRYNDNQSTSYNRYDNQQNKQNLTPNKYEVKQEQANLNNDFIVNKDYQFKFKNTQTNDLIRKSISLAPDQNFLSKYQYKKTEIQDVKISNYNQNILNEKKSYIEKNNDRPNYNERNYNEKLSYAEKPSYIDKSSEKPSYIDKNIDSFKQYTQSIQQENNKKYEPQNQYQQPQQNQQNQQNQYNQYNQQNQQNQQNQYNQQNQQSSYNQQNQQKRQLAFDQFQDQNLKQSLYNQGVNTNYNQNNQQQNKYDYNKQQIPSPKNQNRISYEPTSPKNQNNKLSQNLKYQEEPNNKQSKTSFYTEIKQDFKQEIKKEFPSQGQNQYDVFQNNQQQNQPKFELNNVNYDHQKSNVEISPINKQSYIDSPKQQEFINKIDNDYDDSQKQANIEKNKFLEQSSIQKDEIINLLKIENSKQQEKIQKLKLLIKDLEMNLSSGKQTIQNYDKEKSKQYQEMQFKKDKYLKQIEQLHQQLRQHEGLL